MCPTTPRQVQAHGSNYLDAPSHAAPPIALPTVPQLLWTQVQHSEARNATIVDKVNRLVRMLASAYNRFQMGGGGAGAGGASGGLPRIGGRAPTLALGDDDAYNSSPEGGLAPGGAAGSGNVRIVGAGGLVSVLALLLVM